MKMPWEDDINWGNTATTNVKGEPMTVICKTIFTVPQTKEGNDYINVVEQGYKEIATYTKRKESTTAIILETLVCWEIGQSQNNTIENTVEEQVERRNDVDNT